MKKRSITFAKKPLAVGVASALFALSMAPVHAASWSLGDVDITFDSTFSYGGSWRMEDRNWDTISKVNHPRFDWEGYNAATNNIYTPSQIWQQPGAYSSNGDAGNLNYDRGDMFSSLFKGLHELSITKDNIGLFTRFMYFYDFALMDKEGAYTNPVSGQRVDPCADKDARSLTCRDVRLLDAYVYGNFSFNDGMNPLTVKLGQQVLSWGESTLIQHGINITPIDVGVARAPGAELKEAYIPVGMLTLNIGLTENLSTEMFYQYEWVNSYLPVPGTYFSTNDFAGEGGYLQNVQLGFTGNPDIDLNHLLSSLNMLGSAVASGALPAATAAQAYLAYPTKVTLRPYGSAGELKPEDGGEYGIKFEYFSPELNDTEFALYYMNYHSRVPLISGIASDFSQAGADIGRLAAMAASGGVTKENITQLGAFSKALIEYPEDIKLYGFSFNTTAGETSVAGEISYRKDEPLQIDDVEILYAGMPEQLANAGLRPDLAGISQIGRDPRYGQKVMPGQKAKGFIVSDTLQAQMTFTHLFGPTLGADNLSMVAEVGGISIQDMPDQSVLRLNGPNTDRSGGPLLGLDGSGNLVNKDGLHTGLSNGAETNPFPTASAWGYRLLAKADYNNVFAGVNLSQRVVFSHDVNGITPDPLFLFVEDRKSLAYAVSFDYLSKWSGELSYNVFWGGQGTTNNVADRDFISFNIKYSI
ncbi:MAG: DUF1302 domain-containing protein [Gammaproteobacteria bacterium]|nr:DUF1302 domain-containing protein [Gammaproteobacteria bacterium]MBU1553797.1 DUF1302 domain-containing protein [Gammaproteobacteria bacterium]MBU2072630.1 DUF1302 domain-containing protein [Gammaproteobacteria bacterium]MBU2182236.1 DUF1302 domain-containing protein [Gammaproteobacteria bacterium]MBU2204760.1 DUF1302 domain-containing protein [Gammaproteobacteria bacterium]